MFRNKIVVIDLTTGQMKVLRKKNEPEETYIRGIRISATKQYMIVLLKDQYAPLFLLAYCLNSELQFHFRPFQVWELKTGSLLRSVTFHQITALEWCPNAIIVPSPNNATPPSIKEQFVFATPDGALHFYVVENNQISAMQMHIDIGIGMVSSLAWYVVRSELG